MTPTHIVLLAIAAHLVLIWSCLRVSSRAEWRARAARHALNQSLTNRRLR